MTAELWFVVIGGMTFVSLAVIGFLIAMHFGLRRGNWLPAAMVAVVWVVAMAAYSMWDGEARRDLARDRADALSQGE